MKIGPGKQLVYRTLDYQAIDKLLYSTLTN